MKTVKLNGYKLELYDGDIDEMPIHIRQHFVTALAIESGVGGDLNATDRHLQRLTIYAAKGMVKEHDAIVQNLRQNLFFVVNKVNPKMQAFVYLVKTINGEPLTDYSQENVTRLTEQFGRAGLVARVVNTIIEAVKKKSNDELTAFFPKLMSSPRENEISTSLAKRTRMILKGIIELVPAATIAERLVPVEDHILQLSRPQMFAGVDGVEVKMREAFETTVAIISQAIGRSAKTLSVMEYYTNLNLVKDQQKPKR